MNSRKPPSPPSHLVIGGEFKLASKGEGWLAAAHPIISKVKHHHFFYQPPSPHLKRLNAAGAIRKYTLEQHLFGLLILTDFALNDCFRCSVVFFGVFWAVQCGKEKCWQCNAVYLTCGYYSDVTQCCFFTLQCGTDQLYSICGCVYTRQC